MLVNMCATLCAMSVEYSGLEMYEMSQYPKSVAKLQKYFDVDKF